MCGSGEADPMEAVGQRRNVKHLEENLGVYGMRDMVRDATLASEGLISYETSVKEKGSHCLDSQVGRRKVPPKEQVAEL